jgi:putative acetyltransferase
MIQVRPEEPGDVPSVRVVNERAFGQPVEADLVDRLRRECPEAVSLVAESEGRIVGHILFTPALLPAAGRAVQGMGLAPMAVLPEYQGQGIGSRLVEEGLRVLRKRSCPFVIVLGHPTYYPRFGFEAASRHGIRCQWEGVPDEAFMILFLDESAKPDVRAVARYRDEFDDAM